MLNSYKLTPERAKINSDVLAGIENVERANDMLRDVRGEEADPRPHEAKVCIETRYLEATFKDLCVWSGQIDDATRDLVMLVLRESVKLLQPGHQKYFDAVSKRLADIGKLDLLADVGIRLAK